MIRPDRLPDVEEEAVTKTKTTVYYLSIDGATEPLGNSQIVKYLERIAPNSDVQFVLVTLEKPESARDTSLLDSMAARLDEVGVTWRPFEYSYGLKGTPWNIAVFLNEVLSSEATGSRALVWARGYVPAVAAMFLHTIAGIPYIFDTRGYWFDERFSEGGIFADPTFYRLGKSLETSLFRNAKGVIGLTELVRDDLVNGVLGDLDVPPFLCVPTCAVYEDFQVERTKRELRRKLFRSDARHVVGYIGSINTAYQVDASFRCASELLRREPSSHFVCLTRQTEQAKELCERSGVDPNRTTIHTVRHEEIGKWLNAIDYGLLIRGETFAKRASMPTKLAEFFAARVRPITFPCNDEVRHWVQAARSGFLMDSLDDSSIRAAVDWMIEEKPVQELEYARRITAEHFSLETAAETCRAFVENAAAGKL